jgi:uncharacterized protein
MKRIEEKREQTMFPLYEATVPVFIHFLSNLLTIMGKAERFAKERNSNADVFIGERLAPDMYTFTQQVQYAYFTALDGISKLSGVRHPAFLYDEKTMKELKTSVRRTISYLKTIRPEDFRGVEQRTVPIYYNPKKALPASVYVYRLGLPNFFFHYTTAYDILRHKGVVIGKVNYIGKL